MKNTHETYKFQPKIKQIHWLNYGTCSNRKQNKFIDWIMGSFQKENPYEAKLKSIEDFFAATHWYEWPKKDALASEKLQESLWRICE